MAETSPWLFRYRIWLFAAIFFVSFSVGAVLAKNPPFDHDYGILSLPRDATIASSPGVASSLLPWLALPIALTALGALVRAWGTSYLRGHIMTDSALHTDRLIVSGPFRYLRNPLYTGNLLIGAGYGLLFPPPAMPLCVLGMALLGAALARIEAKAIAARHGADYEQYRKAVRAFVPGPPRSALPPGADVKPDWINGLASEMIHPLACLYLIFIVQAQYVLALVTIAGVFALGWRRRLMNIRARAATAR